MNLPLRNLIENKKSLGWIPVLTFAVLGCVNLSVPGVYMDEAYIDSYVIKILDKSKTVERPLFNLPDNILDSRYRFPVTGASIYAGQIGAYLGVPYYWLVGINATSLRVYHLIYGAITVYLAFLILERMAGRMIGLLGSLLLAVDSGFLLAHRTYVWNNCVSLPFFLFAILLVLRADANSPISPKRAFVVGWLIGLACFGYFIYLLLVPPAIIAVLLWGRPRLNKRSVLSGMVGFICGYAPEFYALFSVYSQAPEWFSSFAAQANDSGNIAMRASCVANVLRDAFANVQVPRFVAGPYEVPAAGLKIGLWALLFLPAAVCVWLDKLRSSQARMLLFCILTIALFFAEMIYFGRRTDTHHAFSLLPFAYIALGILASFVVNYLKDGTFLHARQKSFGISLLFVAMFALAVTNVTQHFALMRQLDKTGGVGLFSSANDQLAADLEARHKNSLTVLTDWGYMFNTFFLARGEFRFTWDIGVSDEECVQKLSKVFNGREPNLTFVIPVRERFASRPMKIADFKALLKKIAEERQFELEDARVFCGRDGVPTVETCTFVRHK